MRSLLSALLLCSLTCSVFGLESSLLAVELANEGDHSNAALEFRRSAMTFNDREIRGVYHWASAYEYSKSGNYAVSDGQLDQAEDSTTSVAIPALYVRGENAGSDFRTHEAKFYFKSILNNEHASHDLRLLTSRKLGALHLQQGDAKGAKKILDRFPEENKAGIRAVQDYLSGSDKKPKVGGWLGMIPGMGYAYAGEYANTLRSIVLNSLFIYGMLDTADGGEWGAFGVITFFEITWYSGSIYGGIDASHRYNQGRLNSLLDEMWGNADLKPDYTLLPALSLKIRF